MQGDALSFEFADPFLVFRALAKSPSEQTLDTVQTLPVYPIPHSAGRAVLQTIRRQDYTDHLNKCSV